MFHKISKEAIRIHGNSHEGKMDIIRSINEIPDRQYLNYLFKINKEMSRGKLRTAFGSKPDTHKAAGVLFATNSGGAIMDVFTKLPHAFNDKTNISSSEILMIHLQSLVITLGSGAVVHLKQYGEKFLKNITDRKQFQDIILSMAENFGEKTLKFILELTQRFIEQTLDGILQELKMFISTESVLYRIIKHVLKNYRDLSCEFIASKANEILKHINMYYISLNTNNTGKQMRRCCDCGGHYFVCM